MKNPVRGILAILPILLFLVYFFYIPLAYLISLALNNPVSDWYSIVSDQLFLRFLGFTILQALITLILSTILGLIAGYILARKNPYQIGIIRTLITVPFIFPPLAILLGFIMIYGSQGIIVTLLGFELNPYSFWGIIISHVMYNISVIARITEAALSNESRELHVLAETLGASIWRRLKTITIPHLRPQLEAGMILVFLYAFNSFAIVLVLGEVRLQTLEVLIYTESRIGHNFQLSAFYVLIQLIINFLVIVFYSRRTYYEQVESQEILKRDNDHRFISTIVITAIIMISWVPVLLLLSEGLKNIFENPQIGTLLFSSEYNPLLGTSSLRVIANTLFFGLIISVLALFLSLLSIVFLSNFRNSNRMEKIFVAISIFPMATSAISLSLGLLSIYGNQDLFTEQVWIYIIAAQLLAALPFASRTILSAWKRVPTDLILVSQTLGASWVSTFEKVIYPFLRSSIIVAVLFSFAISMGEFGATYYLARGEWMTLSISIYRMFGSRNVVLPILYASLLIISSFLVFWLIEKIGKLELRL